MSKINQNAGGFDSESVQKGDDCLEENQNLIQADKLNSENEPKSAKKSDRAELESKKSVRQMNWKQVAHKLREHNRKLYKQVFRLEQELAEITNKFNKYLEKCKSNDLLMAHQAEEIKSYQESVALFSQQLASERQEANSKKTETEQLSMQYELSQKQTAQLERECTLLQEKYNNQTYELTTKEQENQELKIELERQQKIIAEYEARQKREAKQSDQTYRQAETSNKDKASRNQNYPHNRYIQPWSISGIPEKISLPKTRVHSLKAKQTETKAASEVTIRSKSTSDGKTEQKNTAKSAASKKPQSLAAVELPSFPRHQ